MTLGVVVLALTIVALLTSLTVSNSTRTLCSSVLRVGETELNKLMVKRAADFHLGWRGPLLAGPLTARKARERKRRALTLLYHAVVTS